MDAVSILRQASADAARLMQEAAAPAQPDVRKRALGELAGLLTSLPQELGGHWEEIPAKLREEVRSSLAYWASEAERSFREGELSAWIALSVLLVEYGSQVGDPNLLERLVARL